MTLRPIHYISLTLLTLLLLAALAQYQRAALNLTETQIIETYVARYLDTHPQAKLTDCRAQPTQTKTTRMVVICGPEPFDAARHYEYHVGPLGGLIAQNGPADWATKSPVAPRDAA
ncbi:hypothetical protein [Litoreibacter arenae]|uniref:Uncharacterized protein n=1 Tax=Litoreibacter arenae DSM 19593 TaxID=1123360 RepID=S9RP90_9RHOB|nr:hypothetical protein [Litoreibacter arenae]EPX79910.1 hypothetical protein thalar_01246 [Litoreibacter arenae DSM 19593]